MSKPPLSMFYALHCFHHQCHHHFLHHHFIITFHHQHHHHFLHHCPMNLQERCSLLFNVNKDVDGKPLEIPLEEFDEHWCLLISNVWTATGGPWPYTAQGVFGCYQVYIYHLAKKKESSTWREGMPIKKQRKTAIYIPVECGASIKITWIISTSTVCVEWPKDTPDHTHSIEDVNKITCPAIIKDMIAKEASKPYCPPAIVAIIKELTSKDGLEDLVSHLHHQEVDNIQWKHHTTQWTYLVGASILGEDMQDAIQFLQSKGYLCQSFTTTRTPSIAQQSSDSNAQMEGLFFTEPWQLLKLEQHGWLALIDSTHNTNKHGWTLFTLYVWDSYCCWNVEAHFFLSNEDIAGITERLKTIC